MKSCGNCGKPLDDEKGFCSECGEGNHCDASEAVTPLRDEFNVLYDIENFDYLEEGKFEAKRKRKILHSCIAVVLSVALVLFVGVNLVRNKTAAYDEAYTEDSDISRGSAETETPAETEAANNEDTPVVEEIAAGNEEAPVDEEIIESNQEASGENDADDLKQEVKRICSNYNNGRTPYEGELIGVVNDGTTITATYIIPNAIYSEEKENVAATAEEIKKVFSDELSGEFPEEINVEVDIRVSYRD